MRSPRTKEEILRRKYSAGKINVEEFVAALLKHNEFDQERRRIVRNARKVAGKSVVLRT